MEKFYVTKESECSNCEGAGAVQQHDWAAYWSAIEKGKISTSEEDERNFFGDRGYYDHRKYPSEEVQCWKCEGTGVFVEKVELREVLNFLGVTTLER